MEERNDSRKGRGHEAYKEEGRKCVRDNSFNAQLVFAKMPAVRLTLQNDNKGSNTRGRQSIFGKPPRRGLHELEEQLAAMYAEACLLIGRNMCHGTLSGSPEDHLRDMAGRGTPTQRG